MGSPEVAPPFADNALDALERARQAQERYERRIPVQLRLGHADLTLRCPVCGLRADMCFTHGDEWKKRPTPRHLKTDAQLRAAVNEFTQDDPPPYE